MNVELLTAVRDRILERPELFDMRYWVARRHESNGGWYAQMLHHGDVDHQINDLCDTTCCIAGDTVLLARLAEGADWRDALHTVIDLSRNEESPTTIDATAVRLLDLPPSNVDGSACPLFHRWGWPTAYERRALEMVDADDLEPGSDQFRAAVATVAAALIDDMIAGTVEYDPTEDISWWWDFAPADTARPKLIAECDLRSPPASPTMNPMLPPRSP